MADAERVTTGPTRHAMTFITALPSSTVAAARSPLATVDRERLVAYRVPDEALWRGGAVTAVRGENRDGHVIASLPK
jgi:hypothetical protein